MEDAQTVEGEMLNIRRQIRKYENDIEKFKKEKPGQPIPRFYYAEIGRLKSRLAYIEEEVL